MRGVFFVLLAIVGLSGCAANVATNPHDTGGGGISRYEGHSARKPGASGTGSSATNPGQGPVLGSGVLAGQEPGNLDSPTSSNGGQGRTANPNAML